MKKIISLILAMVLLCFSTITAFASTEDDFLVRYTYFLLDVDDCEEYYINGGGFTHPDYPSWSDASLERMENAIAYAREREITNDEELQVAYADLEAVASKMCVDIDELNFMISLFEQETNINNYYDENIWTDFQNLLEKAKIVAMSDDEEAIHHTYIEMRNSFNNLCKYNTINGDLNGDGLLNVKDATYGQKYLAELVEFNSSQTMVSLIDYKNITGITIETITKMQKYIIGRDNVFENDNLDALIAYEGLDENARVFTNIDGNANYVYDRKYNEHLFGH